MKEKKKEIIEITKEWIEDAEEDLKIAKLLLNISPTKSAVFSQQTAEKILKAFLAFHNVEIPKIHIIEKLIKECMKLDKDFENLLEPETVSLSDYYLKKYPPKRRIISVEEAQKAIEIAEKVKEFVIKKLKEKGLEI